MAKSVDSAECVNREGFDLGQITCDPFPVLDTDIFIGGAIGLLVAASPVGGLLGRAVGGVVAGVVAAKLARKYLKKDTE